MKAKYENCCVPPSKHLGATTETGTATTFLGLISVNDCPLSQSATAQKMFPEASPSQNYAMLHIVKKQHLYFSRPELVLDPKKKQKNKKHKPDCQSATANNCNVETKVFVTQQKNRLSSNCHYQRKTWRNPWIRYRFVTNFHGGAVCQGAEKTQAFVMHSVILTFPFTNPLTPDLFLQLSSADNLNVE